MSDKKKDVSVKEEDQLSETQYGVAPYVHTDVIDEDGLIQERYWKQLEAEGWPKELKAIAQNQFWEYDAAQKVFYYTGPIRFGLVVRDE